MAAPNVAPGSWERSRDGRRAAVVAGVVGVVGLAVVGLAPVRSSVEATLRARATEVLAEAAIDGVLVDVSGRDVQLVARGATAPELTRAAQLVAAQDGVRRVTTDGAALRFIPRTEPSTTEDPPTDVRPRVRLQTEDGRLRLSGTVRSRAEADAIQLAAQTAVGVDLVDGGLRVENGVASLGARRLDGLAELIGALVQRDGAQVGNGLVLELAGDVVRVDGEVTAAIAAAARAAAAIAAGPDGTVEDGLVDGTEAADVAPAEVVEAEEDAVVGAPEAEVDADPTPPAVGTSVGPPVMFGSRSAALDVEALRAVAAIVDELGDDARSLVVGHTDVLGDADANRELSRRRAEAVATALRAALPQLEVTVVARGEEQPGPTDELSRRVVVFRDG